MLPQLSRIALAADDAEIVRAGPAAPRSSEVPVSDVFETFSRHPDQRFGAGRDCKVLKAAARSSAFLAGTPNRHDMEILEFAVRHH